MIFLVASWWDLGHWPYTYHPSLKQKVFFFFFQVFNLKHDLNTNCLLSRKAELFSNVSEEIKLLDIYRSFYILIEIFISKLFVLICPVTNRNKLTEMIDPNFFNSMWLTDTRGSKFSRPKLIGLAISLIRGIRSRFNLLIQFLIFVTYNSENFLRINNEVTKNETYVNLFDHNKTRKCFL